MDTKKINNKDLEEEYREYIKTEQLRELRNGKFSNDFSNDSKKSFLPKSYFWRILLSLIILATVTTLAYFIFLTLRIHETSKKIYFENENSSSLMGDIKSTALALIPSQRKILQGEDSERINILLLGAAGENKPGRNLTDTIMIASIDTKSKKIALLSLPRDLYVSIPDSNSFTKINGLYQYGLKNNLGMDPIRKAVEKVIGLPVQYYLVVDFDGFIKFIDILDGINIEVERDIYDERYPGPNYSYETFELKKGFQKLDGETALKYARERHSDPLGDFGRAKRQQQIMQAAKNKAFSIKTILNPLKINDILSSLGDNIKTNLTLEDIESFLVLSKELDTQNISTKVVDAWNKDSLLKVSHVFYNDIRAFVLVPRIGSYFQIHKLAENIFNLENIEKRKIEIEKEDASVYIINNSGNRNLSNKIKKVLSENMGVKNITLSNTVSIQKNNETEVFDFTDKNKMYTLDEIIKSVPAKLSINKEYEDFKKYDFVLVLGKDIISSHEFEDDNIEEFRNAKDSQEYFEISE